MTTCHEHTGCVARIDSLELDSEKQWKEIGKVDDKADKIMSKLNVVLGSMVVACIGLFLNLALELMSKAN